MSLELETIMPRKTSPTFCTPDADVIFESADKVLFHIHRRNLETNSAGFPPAEIETGGEVVPLTEDSTTLELLFSFIYPRRHPDLESTYFAILAPLAEAAEKYEVFAAMNICRIRMRHFLSEYPTQVLTYAARHDYRSIVGDAVPFLLDKPLDETTTALPPNLSILWVRYCESWRRAIFKVFMSPRIVARHSAEGLVKANVPCDLCQNDLAIAMYRMFKKLEERRSRAALEAELSKAFDTCRHLKADEFRPPLMEELDKVPRFDSML